MRGEQQTAILSELVSKLRAKGSWSGEMHLQKCGYLLQEMLGVPMELPFVLYKYGPYSFELHEVLDSMRTDGLIEFEPQPFPYGPKIRLTDVGQDLAKRFEKTRMEFARQITFIVDRLGDLRAADLEEIATAYMIINDHHGKDDRSLAEHLTLLKPRLSMERAREAISQARNLINDAENVRVLS